jgi:hydrogenase nickel incorporation protein HypA/HybF
MHELAVCQALMSELEAIAERERAERILSLQLRIGPLSGVVPELLARAFPIASAGSLAAGAELHIHRLPVRVSCRDCGAETGASPNRLLCGVCGGYRTRLLSGDEMLLASVELERKEVGLRTEDCERRPV